MGIRFEDNLAVLEDFCTVAEAEGLLEWLLVHPHGEVDMSACRHIHSAILQVLLAAGRMMLPPHEDFLRRWIWPSMCGVNQERSVQ